MTRVAASLLLALAGLVLFGQGAYIHAKTLLAQILLEKALPNHRRRKQKKLWYAAHRDTHFRFLEDIVIGDEIAVTRRDGRMFRYRVDSTSVARFDASGIDPLSDRYELVLSTCCPVRRGDAGAGTPPRARHRDRGRRVTDPCSNDLNFALPRGGRLIPRQMTGIGEIRDLSSRKT